MIVVSYTNRGICPNCMDIMWTTDASVSVVCPCTETTLTPNGEANSVTDEEHDVAVRDELGIMDENSEYVMLVKI